MAQIFASFLGGKALMGFWYHFAILFEALFILTAVDAGTRVARFMIQDMIGVVIPAFRVTRNWANNLIGSGIAVAMWGFILYQGVVDPLGGINSLWSLFGISNQMLAGVALMLCTVVLFRMKRSRFAWVTMVPAGWLVICTLTAGLEKLFSPIPALGYLSHLHVFSAALEQGKLLAPAKTMDQMNQIIFNDTLDAVLAGVFVFLVASMLFFAVRAVREARGTPKATAHELGVPQGKVGHA
jgi:carbon starvation protein